MSAIKRKIEDDFLINTDNGEYENALSFHFSRNGNGKHVMENTLKIAYQLPDGTKVHTDNPELESLYDTEATLTEEDDDELQLRFEDFQVHFDELRKAFNHLQVGDKKYMALTKHLRRAEQTWQDLYNEIVVRTHFCNRQKLDWPEIDYLKDTPDNRARIRREELATNRDLERKERV